jgi:uncharacterized membrane protein
MLPYDSNVTNSLIHLYRGEMGRMTLYRVRLDTTTNWSIVTIAAISTFGLGNPEVPHVIFLLLLALITFFLNIEARRFQIYEMVHVRVRLLERFFYHEMLGVEADSKWHAQILGSLANPKSPINRIQAIGWRVRKNYLTIYLLTVALWLLKLSYATGDPLAEPNVAQIIYQARIAGVPGAVVMAIVALSLVILTGLLIYASVSYQLESD